MYRLLAAAAILACATPAAAAPLTFAFTGIETPKGAILMSVYDSEAAFDRGGKPLISQMVAVAGATAEIVADLPPGRYAVKAFHDIDGDGKMGTNPFGIPLEPFAFSNDAVGDMGPAKWSAAAFDFDAATPRHAITIR